MPFLGFFDYLEDVSVNVRNQPVSFGPTFDHVLIPITDSADNLLFRNTTFDGWQKFNTPVPPGESTYNPSENRAWLCGPALAITINQLSSPARRNLFAHRMGNVISGVLWNVINYAMSDVALGQWSSNNEFFKPQVYGLSAGSYNYVAFGPAVGRLGFSYDRSRSTIVRPVTEQAEAFAYITKSKTRAVGADIRTRGCILNENVFNLSDSEYDFGQMHSAAWRRNNQKTNSFWKRLTKQLRLIK